jgi:hypothetical protein
VGNVQHVFCEGYPPNAFTNHLLHIYYTSAWHYEDVTFESGSAKNLALVAPVAGYKVPGVNQLEVYSLTSDYYVNQYTRVVNPVQWIDYDLTNGIAAPLGPIPLGEDGIVAFVTTPNNQRHIYYPSGKEVYQLYYNGTAWSIEDLTGGSGDADTTSGMAGFPIGNLQHVFYLSCSGDPNCR